ncbi:MAG: hypothetical protein KC493_02830, partial [Bacteriovoracaceae bacterium]|nr:hypothetical protein [Bacteriovoracaceae bacterium]
MFYVTDSQSFVLKKYEKVPKNMMTVSSFLARYNKKKVMKNLRDFVSCCRPSRLPGTNGHSKVAPWLVSKIKELDPSGDNLLTVEEFDPDIAHAM